MKTIKLTQDKQTQVDDEDFEKLILYRWHLSNGYAGRWVGGRKNQKLILMHRLIAHPKDKEEVDHLDGNRLNNQKSNLRCCSHAENLQNTKKHKNNTSGFKGVTWDRSRNKWLVAIRIHPKRKYLGRFESLEEAKNAYQEAERSLHIMKVAIATILTQLIEKQKLPPLAP